MAQPSLIAAAQDPDGRLSVRSDAVIGVDGALSALAVEDDLRQVAQQREMRRQIVLDLCERKMQGRRKMPCVEFSFCSDIDIARPLGHRGDIGDLAPRKIAIC